ncbi:MAG: hypothetical protein WCC69_06925 [Pirellulales bacterium]
MHGSFSPHDDRSCCQAEIPGHGVFFAQSCPICGRTLRIAVNLLGSRVYCQHCGGGFMAADDSMRSAVVPDPDAARACDETVDALLAKAEAILARSGGRRPFSR